MSQSVIDSIEYSCGVVRHGGDYLAAIIRRQDGKLFLERTLKRSCCDVSLDEFYGLVWSDECDSERLTSLVYDGQDIVYFNFPIPAVENKKANEIVRIKVRSMLPASCPETEIAWQCVGVLDGMMEVSAAACRKKSLEKILPAAEMIKADGIVLESDSFVKVLEKFYQPFAADECLVVRTVKGSVWIGVYKKGSFRKSVILDYDLSGESDSDLMLFEKDLENVIKDNFTVEQSKCEICFVNAGPCILERLSTFNEKFTVKQIEADESLLLDGMDSGKLGEFYHCIGAGLAGFERYENSYCIFSDLYEVKKDSAKKKSFDQKKMLVIAGCVAAIIFFVWAGYISDRIRLSRYESILNRDKVGEVVQRQQLRGDIAKNRIELPDLLKKITENMEKGVNVDSIFFTRGQRISVQGHTGNVKSIFAFQDKLMKVKEFSNVRLQNQGLNKGKGGNTFTISFDYKNFTGKKK